VEALTVRHAVEFAVPRVPASNLEGDAKPVLAVFVDKTKVQCWDTTCGGHSGRCRKFL
jgi:hypothetical protein